MEDTCMSKFLGPIHFWVYNKIQIQHQIVEEIVKLNETRIPDLADQLEQKYGKSETRPLEEVIDEGNIHGWLQSKVIQEEHKLAWSVTAVLEKRPEAYEELSKIFWKQGQQTAEAAPIENAAEAFKLLGDSLLDGMPCDRANSVLEESGNEVVWTRNVCVHQDYWEEAGGDITVYYNLREAFIMGLLDKTSLEYEKMNEDTFTIRRK
jgi:hypothetical protein